MMRRLYLFDFDGTLTSADTLLCFIRYACGKWRFVLGFALFSPILVLMKLHLYANWRAKQHLFSWYFRGFKLSEFDYLCRRFAADNKHLMRPLALEKLHELFTRNCIVAIVSASIDNWVRPFFYQLIVGSCSDFRVIGTKVEVDDDGLLPGRFLTNYCYGAEKVRRVLAEYPDLAGNRSSYIVEAYGDSRGDRELLAFADNAFYRPFVER